MWPSADTFGSQMLAEGKRRDLGPARSTGRWCRIRVRLPAQFRTSRPRRPATLLFSRAQPVRLTGEAGEARVPAGNRTTPGRRQISG